MRSTLLQHASPTAKFHELCVFFNVYCTIIRVTTNIIGYYLSTSLCKDTLSLAVDLAEFELQVQAIHRKRSLSHRSEDAKEATGESINA